MISVKNLIRKVALANHHYMHILYIHTLYFIPLYQLFYRMHQLVFAFVKQSALDEAINCPMMMPSSCRQVGTGKAPLPAIQTDSQSDMRNSLTQTLLARWRGEGVGRKSRRVDSFDFISTRMSSQIHTLTINKYIPHRTARPVQ